MIEDLPPTDPERAALLATQRGHLRRILQCFVAVIVLLPLVGLGGAWSLLLVPLLALGWVGMLEALRLRRSVRLHGDARHG